MKKKVILGLFVLCIIVGIGIFVIRSEEKYTYEWVEEKDSAIGQYRLYINNSKGKHIDGTARIVYINGKTKRMNIDKDGLLYVKSVVAEVRNPDKR